MADTDDKAATPDAADPVAEKVDPPAAQPADDASVTPASGDNASSTPTVPTTPSAPSAPAAPDAITFQEQGVFYANMLEVVRVLGVVGNRVIALEGKVGGMSGGTDVDPALKALPDTVAGMKDAEKGMQDDIAALKDEVKKLGFPDGK